MTKDKFIHKHHAAMQAIMQSIFGLTSSIADLRTCAEKAAGEEQTGTMADTAKQLDICCACLVRLISKLPVEMLMCVYDCKTIRKQEPA